METVQKHPSRQSYFILALAYAAIIFLEVAALGAQLTMGADLTPIAALTREIFRGEIPTSELALMLSPVMFLSAAHFIFMSRPPRFKIARWLRRSEASFFVGYLLAMLAVATCGWIGGNDLICLPSAIFGLILTPLGAAATLPLTLAGLFLREPPQRSPEGAPNGAPQTDATRLTY
jgi:hypothetical protein